MDYMKTPVEARISFSSHTNGGGLTAVIRLTDRMSNLTVAEVEFSPEQFTELLASRAAVVMAEFLPEYQYHKVGKQFHWEQVNDWKEDHPEFLRFSPGWDEAKQNRLGASAEMITWAEWYIKDTEWSNFSWRLHNFGWELSVFRYSETTEDERQKRLDRYDI